MVNETNKIQNTKYDSTEETNQHRSRVKKLLVEAANELLYRGKYRKNNPKIEVPENHNEGIEGMNLFDLVEMLFDLKVSSESNGSGDIKEYIKNNKEQFGMDDQICDILMNTADRLYEVKPTE